MPLPHERDTWIETDDGVRLAARLSTPDLAPSLGWAVVCHPHTQMGGTSDSPVVAAAVAAARTAGLVGARFDFRGAGRSGGRFGHGVQERRDVRAVVDRVAGEAEGRRVLVGYSFGAAVAAATVRAGLAVDRLVLIAPPLSLLPVELPPELPEGVRVFVGDRDEYCSVAAVRELVASAGTSAALRVLTGVDHFFGGSGGPLNEALRWALG